MCHLASRDVLSNVSPNSFIFVQTPQSDLCNLDGLGQSVPLVLMPSSCGKYERLKADAHIMWPVPPFFCKLEDLHFKYNTKDGIVSAQTGSRLTCMCIFVWAVCHSLQGRRCVCASLPHTRGMLWADVADLAKMKVFSRETVSLSLSDD